MDAAFLISWISAVTNCQKVASAAYLPCKKKQIATFDGSTIISSFNWNTFICYICSGHSSLSQRLAIWEQALVAGGSACWTNVVLKNIPMSLLHTTNNNKKDFWTDNTIPRSMLCLPVQVLNLSGYIYLKGVREKEYERYNRREEEVRLEICTLAPSAPTSLLPFIHFKTFPIQCIYVLSLWYTTGIKLKNVLSRYCFQ